jgi:hypothetical protein
MVSTAIATTSKKSNFNYHPGINFVYRSQNRWFQDTLIVNNKKHFPLGNSMSALSTNKKVVITLNMGMFHFWYDSAGPLFRILEEHPDLEVLIDNSFLHMDTDKTFYDFFLKVLKDKGVNYKEFSWQSLDSLVVNNFYSIESFERIDDSPNVTYRNLLGYLDQTAVADKVVYLSRRRMGERPDTNKNNMVDGLPYYDDNRIDDEPKLEKYLESLGVTIVVPEDFSSFQEQINYFNTVKTVISLTSSGLANSIFMKSGSNVIEFITPLVIMMFPDENNPGKNHGEISIHNLYNLISWSRKHTHIAVQNKTRSADDLIEHLKSTRIIQKVIEND